jgi:hypothetical protein
MDRQALARLGTEARGLLRVDPPHTWVTGDVAVAVDLATHEQVLRAALTASPGPGRGPWRRTAAAGPVPITPRRCSTPGRSGLDAGPSDEEAASALVRLYLTKGCRPSRRTDVTVAGAHARRPARRPRSRRPGKLRRPGRGRTRTGGTTAPGRRSAGAEARLRLAHLSVPTLTQLRTLAERGARQERWVQFTYMNRWSGS